jgi:hypothetical protein
MIMTDEDPPKPKKPDHDGDLRQPQKSLEQILDGLRKKEAEEDPPTRKPTSCGKN